MELPVPGPQSSLKLLVSPEALLEWKRYEQRESKLWRTYNWVVQSVGSMVQVNVTAHGGDMLKLETSGTVIHAIQ